jgi:hypothetical protein
VLPLVTETIRVAEAIRRAAMARFQRWCERNPAKTDPFRRLNAKIEEGLRYSSEVLSGKDGVGRILGARQHASYIPTAEGVDRRRITHVTVVAPMGFNDAEVCALSSIRWLKMNHACVRVQLMGLGRGPQFRIPLFGAAQEWLSVAAIVFSST